MDGWMDGYVVGLTDKQTNGWMDGWTVIEGPKDGWMMDGWMDDGWMDGWMSGWTDGWPGGYVDVVQVLPNSFYVRKKERKKEREKWK